MDPLRYSLLMWLVCSVAGAQTIFTIAGIPYGHRDSVDSKLALNAPLNNVHGLLIDKITGRLLFSDFTLLMRLEPDQSLLVVAGRGLVQDGETADNTPASFLKTTGLVEMAQDAAGALYVSDLSAGRVYRIAPDGTVTTFAGGGRLGPGFQSDGGPATAAQLASPRGLAFDSKGNLNIGEVYCACIRRVSPDGIISTVYTIPPSQQPRMHEIEGLAIDAQDNLYFTEWIGHVVVRVAPDGTATTIAGTGVAGFSGDGGPATAAQLNRPSGVTLDANGNLYITDSMNHRVRKVARDGTISTFAGTGQYGFSGDGGLASEALLSLPAETVFDGAGNMYITDFGNQRVRRVAPNGTIVTVAGNAKADPSSSAHDSSGDGGPAIHATLNPGGTVVDASGNLYVSDGLGNRIRKIAPDGSINTFAGTGVAGYSGDGGPASHAMLYYPGPLAMDARGNIYVISSDSRIRKITPDGIISLVAGTGMGYGPIRSQGDGGLAVNATLNEVGGIAFDTQGNIYIADTSNARLRKIDTSGIITTIAGPGQLGVDYYNAVAVDSQDNIFLAWTHATVDPNASVGTVNRVNPDGSLTRVAGNGQTCPGGPVGLPFPFDGAPALQAVLCQVPGMMIDKDGIMYLVYGSLLLRITNDGIIHIVAGNPLATALGDGGPVLQASLGVQGGPGLPTFDSTGNMYFAQRGLGRVREVTSTPYALKLSPDHIDAVGPMATTWSIATSANFTEPFPCAVRVRTADGGSWLSANRVTGLIGDSITVTVDPAGLAPGSYQGTISVIVGGSVGSAIAQQLDLPVSLSVP